MTAFATPSVRRAVPAGTAVAGPAQRFLRSLTSFGAVVLDSIEASRAIGSAHTVETRREVLERFSAQLSRDAARPAA